MFLFYWKVNIKFGLNLFSHFLVRNVYNSVTQILEEHVNQLVEGDSVGLILIKLVEDRFDVFFSGAVVLAKNIVELAH